MEIILMKNVFLTKVISVFIVFLELIIYKIFLVHIFNLHFSKIKSILFLSFCFLLEVLTIILFPIVVLPIITIFITFIGISLLFKIGFTQKMFILVIPLTFFQLITSAFVFAISYFSNISPLTLINIPIVRPLIVLPTYFIMFVLLDYLKKMNFSKSFSFELDFSSKLIINTFSICTFISVLMNYNFIYAYSVKNTVIVFIISNLFLIALLVTLVIKIFDLKYAENNTDLEISKIITNVNSNLDKTKYEDTEKTNIKDDNLMLVNKYYYLTEDYTPNDLVTLTSKYNTGINSQMRKEAANNFMKMSDAATLDNITIKNASGYRSYNYQVNLYDKYVQRDGKKAADTYSARPGFSEHQTGLVSDINQIDNSFENTDAFKWLQKNAYKYGFILRFPKDKEDVTGYQYEPWHYRYVGEYVAEKMHDENLTLEEFYAYYAQNKK